MSSNSNRMMSADLEDHVKIHNFLTDLSGIFKKYPALYAYEIEGEDRYGVSVSMDMAFPILSTNELKVDPDIAIKAKPGENFTSMSIRIKSLKFLVKNINFHKFVKLNNSHGCVFRSGSTWLVLMGSTFESPSEISLEVNRMFDEMFAKKKGVTS